MPDKPCGTALNSGDPSRPQQRWAEIWSKKKKISKTWGFGGFSFCSFLRHLQLLLGTLQKKKPGENFTCRNFCTYWAPAKEMHFKLCCACQTAPRHVSWRLPGCNSEKIQEYMSNNFLITVTAHFTTGLESWMASSFLYFQLFCLRTPKQSRNVFRPSINKITCHSARKTKRRQKR